MREIKFIVLLSVQVPRYYGGGWNMRSSLVTMAAKGDIIKFSTNLTPACGPQNAVINITWPDGSSEETGFDNLGRLIACGAIKQTES